MIPDVVRDGVECASDDTGNSHCAGVELVVARMMIQIQTQWEGTDVRDSEIARHAVRRSRFEGEARRTLLRYEDQQNDAR